MNPESRSHRPGIPRSPREIDAVASQWVIRRASGLGEAEERELAAWVAANPAHEEAIRRFSEMSAALQRARNRGSAGDIAAALAVRARRRRGRRRFLMGTGSAAVLALAAVWGHRFESTPGGAAGPIARPLAVQPFEPIRRLPDGSVVELDAESEITVNYESAVRHVELVRGEALFKVQKDPNRPFIVRAGGVEVRAVGTAFDVRLGSAAVEVFVTEGKVGVNDVARGESMLPRDSTGRAATLQSGERAVIQSGATASASPSVQITPFSREEIGRSLSWIPTRLQFDGLALSQAIEQVNRHNREQIALEGDSIGRLRISGNFVADDPQTFSRLVAASFGLECDARGAGEIILRKK